MGVAFWYSVCVAYRGRFCIYSGQSYCEFSLFMHWAFYIYGGNLTVSFLFFCIGRFHVYSGNLIVGFLFLCIGRFKYSGNFLQWVFFFYYWAFLYQTRHPSELNVLFQTGHPSIHPGNYFWLCLYPVLFCSRIRRGVPCHTYLMGA
jgi:hypothetical protein